MKSIEESQGLKINNGILLFCFVMDARITCFGKDSKILYFASCLSLDEYICQILAEVRILILNLLG